MNVLMDPTPFVVVGLVSCAIGYCEDNLQRFTREAEQLLERIQPQELEPPFFNLTVEVKLRYNNSCFLIQVSPTSSKNDYAVFSGDTYSIFKLSDKIKNNFTIIWQGETYDVNLERELTTFKLIINQNDIVYIYEENDHLTPSSTFKFDNNLNLQSEEVNSSLDSSLSELNNILMGYVIPEPFFSTNIYILFEKIFTTLRDPLLPALQFRKHLDDFSCSLSNILVTELQQILGQYTSNFSSLFSRFPSTEIKFIIEKNIKDIDDNIHKLNIAATLRPLLELAEMYSDGIRGNTKFILENILQDYLNVEIKFQDDEIIRNARITNKQITVTDLLSHNALPQKNKLILTLIDFLVRFLPGIISDLNDTIKTLLLCINGNGYSQLIPRLREILITGQIPSYEVRKNEMESIFLTSINGSSNCVQTNRLENLICSNSEVFDIISDFFYHKVVAIRKCAMEVYIRRAYMAYEISSFEQSQLSTGEVCVLFKFSLPTNNRQRNLTGYEIKRSNSYLSIINGKAPSTRKSFETSRNIIPISSIEKEDISDGELSNEDYFQTYFLKQKSLDYDTDSAISIGTFSQSELSANLSEQVDNDSALDHNINKSRSSPADHSLEKLWVSPIPLRIKDAADNTKVSNDSLDRVYSFRHNRHSSMFCNNSPAIQIQDFSSNESLGLMIIFESLEEIEKKMTAIRKLLILRNSTMDDMDFHEYNIFSTEKECSPLYKVVLKLILRDPLLLNKHDDEVGHMLFDFCEKHLSFFYEIRVLRITFLLQSMDKTIRYFTFRYKGHFEEDIIIRNIDPILSFQLEVNRLRNYHLERLPVPNRRMYVYMGICKQEMSILVTVKYRMFARCIIHHNDFHSTTANISYVAKEAEQNLIEAMDAFDMAWVDERANLTNSNHIFFYFHSILCLNKMDELENVVRTIIFKYGRRLWSLRITQAELKMSVKLNNAMPIPVRLWVHNEGGKSLDICIYREEFQFKTNHKVLVSCSLNKEGRYHGVPVDCFYSI